MNDLKNIIKNFFIRIKTQDSQIQQGQLNVNGNVFNYYSNKIFKESVSYLTFLTNGKTVSDSIYPALYFYPNTIKYGTQQITQNRIFVVFGKGGKSLSNWNIDSKYGNISNHYSENERAIIQNRITKFNYLDNKCYVSFTVYSLNNSLDDELLNKLSKALIEVIDIYLNQTVTIQNNKNKIQPNLNASTESSFMLSKLITQFEAKWTDFEKKSFLNGINQSICFLKNGNTVGNGIYPAIYFYPTIGKLFSVFGSSEKHNVRSWNEFKGFEDDYATIDKYLASDNLNREFKFTSNSYESVWDVNDLDDNTFAEIENSIEYIVSRFNALNEEQNKLEVLTPTEEQLKILNSKSDLIIIKAFAGTGKTSTLKMFARAIQQNDKNSKMLYIAFNKAMASEASGKFLGTNTEVKTAHSLAKKYVPLKGNPKEYRAGDLKTVLKLNDNILIIDQAYRFFNYYCNSSAKEMTKKLLDNFMSGSDTEIKDNDIVFLANEIWNKMENHTIPYTHDFYLKKFQLSGEQLKEYSYILFDEAQDASPAMLDIVMNQKNIKKVFVGDSHQQIYSWRYAVDALETVESDENEKSETFALTESFRFDAGIANCANILLKIFKHEKETIKGSSKVESLITDDDSKIDLTKQYCFISRTNGALFKYGLDNHKNRLFFQKAVHNHSSGFEERFHDLLDIYNVSRNMKEHIHNPFFKSYDNINALRIYATKVNDLQILSFIKIVDDFQNKLIEKYNLLKESTRFISRAIDADVILTTAHTAKGLEYEQVVIADDFEAPLKKLIEKLKNREEFTKSDYEEVNLLYVTLTRSKRLLVLPTSIIESLQKLSSLLSD